MVFSIFPAYFSVDAQIQAGQVAGVKITSDQDSQAVPIREQLTIYSTSTDNSLIDCHVYLTVNGRGLSQPAIASGPGGIHDYSQWQLTLTPDNSGLQEGANNITANYSCIDNIAKDSINVIERDEDGDASNQSEGLFQSRDTNELNNVFKSNSTSENNNTISLDQYQEAIEYFDLALEIEPNATDILTNKGILLTKSERYDEALQVFDKILSIDANNTGALYNKGVVLDKLGKHDEAILYYKMTSQIDPNYISENAEKPSRKVERLGTALSGTGLTAKTLAGILDNRTSVPDNLTMSTP